MGTISSVFEKPARSAAVIGSEDEAASVAAGIARMWLAPGPDEAPGAAEDVLLERLARSGLLGISVPTEHGGLDVSNTVLADVCAILGEASVALGEIAASHYCVVEWLRSHGTAAQKVYFLSAALAGVRFSRTGPHGAEAPLLQPDGPDWTLDGKARCTPAAHLSEWMLVTARHAQSDETVRLLVPARLDGIVHAANGNDAGGWRHAVLRAANVSGDSLLQSRPANRRPDVAEALSLLLQGAVQHGLGRRALHATIAAVAKGESLDDAAAGVGAVSIRLTAAGATLDVAGRAVDAAQIGEADQHRLNALLAATAADHTAAEAAQAACRLFQSISGIEPGDGTLLSETEKRLLQRIAGDHRLSEGHAEGI